MRVKPTRLAGLRLFDLESGKDSFEDSRGYFRTVARFKTMRQEGHLNIAEFGQLNISYSVGKTIRGIHAEPWDKLVYVVRGHVHAVEVDLRSDSPTFGQHESFELDRNRLLFVPQGFGNAFQAYCDTHYLYLTTDEWRQGVSYPAVSYKDPDLAIKWPHFEDRIVSPKDEGHPTMRQLFPDRYR